MKYLFVFTSSLLLSGCIDVSSFKKPEPSFVWSMGDDMGKFYRKDNPYWVAEYFEQREEDAKVCGVEPKGPPDSAKAGLCMESKGWSWELGPVCKNRKFYKDPLCVQWRANRRESQRVKPIPYLGE